MSNELLIQVRNVYGTPTIYPINETAQLFARIAGTKTLTHPTLEVAEQLGYTIAVQPEPIPKSLSKWQVAA